ncbi:MAG: glycosyltransferase [Acidobacteriota bacterium]
MVGSNLGRPLRVAFDGRPLLPPHTGVYRYTAGLLAGLEEVASEALQLTVLRPPRAMATSRWVLLDMQRVTGRGFDVVHFPFYYPPLVPRCPVTVTVHDTLVLEHPDWFPRAWGGLMRLLIARGARRAAAVVTPSRHVATSVERLCGVAAERLRVIPHGVDARTWFPPPPAAIAALRRQLDLPRRWIVQLGAVEPRRGVDLLLRAAQTLRLQEGELEVVLVGGVRRPIPELRPPPPGVRVIPWLDDPLLPPLLAGAAAVVAPSRGEGFDLPVLEALACGAAVVASDIPVHREHFAGAVELFPSGDAGALAAALSRLLVDPARGNSLRAAAVAHARRFTWSECARAHLALWREVVQRSA